MGKDDDFYIDEEVKGEFCMDVRDIIKAIKMNNGSLSIE